MLRYPATRLRRPRDGERGAVLVITAAAMFTVLVIAAFVIDVGIWYVHGKHLQTEADSAALAGAQLFQFPCTSGASTSGTTDNAIKTVVNQYDGTQAPPTGTYYNPQVNVEPTPATIYSPTAHNLFSELNASQFENQNLPNPGDSLTGSPCTDSAIDVKLTETNLPSYFPFINPSYVNKEAEVSIENLSTTAGLEPLAEPLPTPNSMTAYLIDEGNGDSVLATVNLSPVAMTNDAQWTATTPFTFTATGPIGMEIATANSTGTVACSNGSQCFDATDNIGVTYTRVWTNGSPNYPTAAPVVRDATVTPTASGGCPGAPTTAFSNFISTSTSCTVTLSANLQFGSGAGATCSNTGTFTVTPGTGTPVALNPPTGCTGSASPNGIWTSAPITVAPSVNGIPLTLSWSQTTGSTSTYKFATGGDNQGNCTANKPCTYNFPGTVQRIFSGAYDDQSISSSTNNSGPILAASIDDPTGAAIQSIQSGTATTITLNVNVESFQNSLSIPSAPIELSFGGNQANALVSCPGGSSGQGQSETAIAQGCTQTVGLDTNFSATPCNPTQTGTTYICLPTVSGNGKLDEILDPAIDCKINGAVSGGNCTPSTTCAHPNYWPAAPVTGITPITLNQLLNESTPDPRLIKLFTTDNGALGNGRTQVPIRVITYFYVTGWSPAGSKNKGGSDPCLSSGNNTITFKDGTSASEPYFPDTAPSATVADPSGVLLGHFVEYTVLGGTGSGKCVQTNGLGTCVGILTK